MCMICFEMQSIDTDRKRQQPVSLPIFLRPTGMYCRKVVHYPDQLSCMGVFYSAKGANADSRTFAYRVKTQNSVLFQCEFNDLVPIVPRVINARYNRKVIVFLEGAATG